MLERDGTVTVVASGSANHAGHGGYSGIRSGNRNTIGVEAANDGVGEPWSPDQLKAYHILSAAIISHLGTSSDLVIGHKEWTTRKIDPTGIDMSAVRRTVDELVKNGWDRFEPADLPAPPRPLLRQGVNSEAVKLLQERLNVHGAQLRADGSFGPLTHQAVRIFQEQQEISVDGIVGPQTWARLDEEPAEEVADQAVEEVKEEVVAAPADAPSVPAPSMPNSPAAEAPWRAPVACRNSVLRAGSRGRCVNVLQRRLNGLGFRAGAPDGIFGQKTEYAVRDFQDDRGIAVDGIVGPQTWGTL
jgi:peptidoglycan hydrolase-like protein with peptidoglycan-binding domain